MSVNSHIPRTMYVVGTWQHTQSPYIVNFYNGKKSLVFFMHDRRRPNGKTKGSFSLILDVYFLRQCVIYDNYYVWTSEKPKRRKRKKKYNISQSIIINKWEPFFPIAIVQCLCLFLFIIFVQKKMV